MDYLPRTPALSCKLHSMWRELELRLNKSCDQLEALTHRMEYLRARLQKALSHDDMASSNKGFYQSYNTEMSSNTGYYQSDNTEMSSSDEYEHDNTGMSSNTGFSHSLSSNRGCSGYSSVVVSLEMQLSVLEGVRQVYYEYSARKANQIHKLWKVMQDCGVSAPEDSVSEASDSDMETTDMRMETDDYM